MVRSWEVDVGMDDSSVLLQVESMVDLVADRCMRSFGRPSTGWSSADRMPHSLAMAHAVVLLSPATRTTQDLNCEPQSPAPNLACDTKRGTLVWQAIGGS